MSYSDGEAAILATLRLHTNYNPNNTSRGNWNILNTGRSDRYAVLRMGAATNEQHAISGALTTWQTDVMVYRLYANDGPSAINLQEHVQEIVEHLEKYPTLSGAVTDVQIVGISAMETVDMTGNGPVWLRTIISLQWQEEREITYS